MIKMYVMQTCPYCTYVEKQVEGNPNFKIIDIGKHVHNLKEFLDLRDHHPAFDEAKKIAKKYGLIACFHPHLGSIAERPKEIDELLSYSNIKVCPDVAHLAAGGYDPQKFIEKYYDRIALIHLKDLNSEGFAPLGKGKIDLKGVIAYVKSRGYEGDWLVEVDGYAGDAKEACEISYEYLKNNLL